MSLNVLRQAALSSRRTYPVGEKVDAKRPEGGLDPRGERNRSDAGTPVPVEPHWWASIELATD